MKITDCAALKQFCQKSMIPLLRETTHFVLKLIPLSNRSHFAFSINRFCLYFHKTFAKNDTNAKSNKMRFCLERHCNEAQWKLLFLFAVSAFLRDKMLPSFLDFWRRDLCFKFPYKEVRVGVDVFGRGKGENLRCSNSGFVPKFCRRICVFRIPWIDYVLQISRLLWIVNNLLCLFA